MFGYSESLGPRFKSWRAHHFSLNKKGEPKLPLMLQLLG